jgi:hypothetical protein
MMGARRGVERGNNEGKEMMAGLGTRQAEKCYDLRTNEWRDVWARKDTALCLAL